MGRIDRIVDNQSLMQLAQRMDALQTDVRALNGRIEELQNANETLRKQQRDLYADLDQRLKAAAAAPAPAPVRRPLMSPQPRRCPRSPMRPPRPLRRPRLQHRLRGDETGAVHAGLRCAQGRRLRRLRSTRSGSWRRAFPAGTLADNTQYWLGEAYYVTRDYDHAAACLREGAVRLAELAQGAGCAAEARLHAVRAEARGARARTTLQQVVVALPGQRCGKAWLSERLQKIPADAH